MGMATADVSSMDYGAAVPATPNTVTALAAVALTAKIGVSYTVIPTASAAGTVQMQVTDFDNQSTIAVPPQAGTWCNIGSAQTIVAGTPLNVQAAAPWSRLFRLVVTAGASSSGSFSVAINLRANYGS